MANRYWVGGTASWDATAGTKWSETSGGAGGASVPTSSDDVFFDVNSGTVTVTVSGSTANCNNLNFTGFAGTFTGSGSISMNASFTASASTTWTHTGLLSFSGSGAQTITSAGKTLGPITISGLTLSYTLQDSLVSSGAITLTAGTFNTNNYNVTAGAISSSNSNIRAINLGSSTVTLSSNAPLVFSTNTNLTFNAGTSNVLFTGSGATIQAGAQSLQGVTFYNVSFPSQFSGTHNVEGICAFNNLNIDSPVNAGYRDVSFNSPQTINGILSTSNTAGNRRVLLRSRTYGIGQTLTVNGSTRLTDADFRDIYVVGTAAPISGTRIGDLRGCSGITFSAPKTVYWNLGGTSATLVDNAWASTSGGTPNTDNFPLAQDTAKFDNSSTVPTGNIITNSAIPYIGTIDMGSRTTAIRFQTAANPFTVYGDFICGSGTTISDTGGLTFSGRNKQTITSAGKTFSGGITVDSYGGTVELADALNIATNTLTVTNGTFDTKGYAVTAAALSSNNSNVRTITLGSSVVTLISASGTTFTTTTNLTFDAGTSSIVFTTSSTGTQLASGGLTFYDVSFTGTSNNISATITGNNTYRNLSFAAPSSAGLAQYLFAGNSTVSGALTVAGASPIRRIFVRSDTVGTPRALTIGTLNANDCDFRDITIAGTATNTAPVRAGDCGGNSGIVFPAAKTVYWNLAGTQNWSATGWASTSGGTPDASNFPLAQDTAVFNDAGAAGTVTLDQSWNIGTFDATNRTTSMTVSTTTVSPSVYKDWKFGTGVTSSSTTGTLTFSGRGTQTITSNGVTFGCPVTINCVTGIVNLADALTLAASRSLTLTSGTFNAVNYNVSVNAFSCTGSPTLKMGSGTWTITSNGTGWSVSTNLVLYKGTANIILSDTSTASRTFTGGGLSYNKLTIGGATGTSTTTITGNNQFTELASTKTVAHTIDLGTTAQTFGKWSVSGSAGNVVTLSGTGASHVLVGSCTDGIDYLAMGSIGFASSSPGEFYAGANSTGTAGAPVYRTAKPADSVRYWVGGTGNWSDTARWSESSGGSGGASVPRSHDDVVFDSASSASAYTVTVNAVTGGIRMKSLTVAGPASGNITLAGSASMDGIHGNITLPATGLTRTYTGWMTLSGSTPGLILTTNGVELSQPIQINGVGCEWLLGSSLTNSTNSGNLSIINGTLDLNNYNINVYGILSNYTNSRAIYFRGSTTGVAAAFNLGATENERANLIFQSNTSQINFSTIAQFYGNNQTFYNVNAIDANSSTMTINGQNVFNNFSSAGNKQSGLKSIILTANQVVNGTLTFSPGTGATTRHFLRSDAIGTTRTITAAAVVATDVDFRDIAIVGAAAPVSGTRLGDCKGNSGITFPAPKTVYCRSTGSATWSSTTAWSATEGSTADITQFPLAQDTVVFPASTYPASGSTITIDASYNIGTIDMSARTSNTMTLATSSNSPAVYGNWINGTRITLTGTGMMTFAGQGNQSITSAGKTFTQGFTLNSPGGVLSLQDAYSVDVTSAFTLTAGTLNTNSYNISTINTSNSVAFSGTGVRAFALGSGIFTINASGGNAFNASNSTNLTVTGNGTIRMTSASAKTFAGGGADYSGITLDQGGAGTLTITGNNTFKDITNSYSATGAATINIGTTTQKVQQWTATGASGKVLTVTGTSASSPGTLILTGSTKPNVDYLNIVGIRAYSLRDTWYAGPNSTNSGYLGWIFSAAVAQLIKKLYVGANNATQVYLGSTPVTALYYGSTKVWG